MRKLTPWFLLGLVVLSACKKSSSDTYVVLDFIGSVSDAAPIASLSVDLELAGERSGTSFTASGNDRISLPTTATLRIGHGSGELQVVAVAKAADGQVLGRGSGHGQVIAGQTQQIVVRFGGSDDAGVSGAGQDALPDGAGPSPGKGGEDAAKAAGDGARWFADGTGVSGDGAAGGGGVGGGKGGAGGSGRVVLDGGLGGRAQDANSTGADAPAGGAGGTGGLGGAGGASTVNPGLPKIISEPSALDFGVVDLGKPGSQRSTTIRNIGTAPSPVLFIELSPAGGPFSIIGDGCAGKALGAGEDCTMNLGFSPSVKGIANGRLTVKAGTLGGTEIGLSGAGALPGQAQLTVQPTQGEFAQVNVGNRANVVFTVTNTGSAPANGVMVFSNSASAVFQINNDQCSNRVLQPGVTCTFAMTFSPMAPGLETGTVTIKCPDVPEPLIVNLSGTGKTAEVVLTVDLLGNGGGTISAPGLSCQGTVCTGKYDPGAVGVSLTLNAKPDGYSTFAGWSGGPCNDSSPSCTFVLTGPTTMSAKFTAGTVQVGLGALSLQGHTGSITSSDGILNCSGQCPPAPHPKTGNLILVATPAAGSTFVGWTEGPCRGANPTCSISLNSDIFVSGTFGPQSYMFVTSTSIVPGRLGGLAGADAECTARAQAGGLPGIYRAWISAAGIAANSRVGSGGWVRVDGRPFARNLASLAVRAKQVVFYPPRIDEYGEDVGPGHMPVVTGSDADGSNSGDQCGGLASTTGAIAVGDALAGGSMWGYSQLVANGCANSYRLYCFNTSVPGDLRPPPGPGKRIFISKDAWSPLGDISNADAFCRADATDAGLPNANTFVALLATTTVAASTRLTPGSGPWKRMDDVLVFRSPSEMASNILVAAPGLLADGSYGDFVFWSGASGPGVVGLRATSCQDWSSSASADYGQIGNADLSGTPDWFASPGNGNTCDSRGPRLLCAEP